MCFCRSSASGPPGPRSAIARSCAICPRICRSGTRSRRPPTRVSAPSVRATTTVSSPACASAPPNPTSSSSTTTCCARTRRVRQNAYGEVIPSCSRAIIDEAHQLEDVATQHFGFSVSNYRFEELARDVQKVAGSAPSKTRTTGRRSTRRSPVCANHATAFFTEVAFAHRGDGRLKSEERVRATPESLGQTLDAAAHLTGALDILESTLQLTRRLAVRLGQAGEPAAGRDADADPTRARTSRRWCAAPASCGPSCVSCSAAATTTTSSSSSFADAACSCARRRSTSPRSSATLLDRQDAHDGPDVGHADRRRRVRLHPHAAGHRRRRRSASPLGVRLQRGRRSCTCRSGCRIRGRIDSRSRPAAR